MDLTNLTLDELLDQIRSDSSYIEATKAAEAKKEAPTVKKEPSKTTKPAKPAKPVAAIIEEPISAPTAQEPKPQPEPVMQAAPEPLPVSEPMPVHTTEAFPVFEPVQDTEHEPQPPFIPFRDNSSEALSPNELDDIANKYLADISDEANEHTVFEPDLPNRTNLFLSLEPEEEEAPQAIFYSAPTAQKELIEIIEEPEFQPQSFFEPLPITAPVQPLEIIEEEPYEPTNAPQFYTPPVPEVEKFELFANINIDADVSSFFPEIKAEEPTDPQPKYAEEKTIVVERLTDKTAVFERPGIITGKSMFGKTADLSAIPAIISADEVLKDKYLNEQKTFVRTGTIPIVASQAPQRTLSEPDDGQMILPGFGAPDEPVEHVDETKVEDELRNRRSEKVSSFHLEGVTTEDTQLSPEEIKELTENAPQKKKRFSSERTHTRLTRQTIEYRKPSDAENVSYFIHRQKLRSIIAAIISGICAVVLLLTTALPTFVQKINSLSSGISVSGIIALSLLLVSFVASLPCCSSGISCFFSSSGRPNTQTPVVFAAIAAILQCVPALTFDKYADMPLFAAAAAFILCINAAGKSLSFKRIENNFHTLASKSRNELYAVKTIDNISDANRIGKNIVMGEADIRYSGKTKFVSNFLTYSMASDAADDLCAKLVPLVAAASVVIGVIAGIASKSAIYGLSLFVGAICMGAPASAAFCASLPLSRVNKKLRSSGAFITSYAAAFDYEATNAVALDAQDLFPGSCCNIHGMKTFYGVRIDDAILTAASMLTEAGSPISSLFNEVVLGRKELLMNVEDLTYEDRLGLSGWVRGRRVFVGNRKLLEHHNIEIPMSVDEAKYRHDGRRVIYLADAGKIAAIFVVSYGTDVEITEHIRKIENNGINLLIRSTDSNITEEFVANTFGLPLNSVKIVNPNAADVLKTYADTVTRKEDARLVHNGKAASFLQCISLANFLCWAAGVVNTQQTFCCAAGLLLLAGMVIFSGVLSVTALQICICQLVWLGIGAIVPLINKE